jgi:hypothetical protein
VWGDLNRRGERIGSASRIVRKGCTMTVADFRSASPRAGRGDSFVRRRLESPLALASAVFVASLAWTLVVRFPLLRAYGADDAGFVGMAHLWLRGVLPYAGVFDVKPPGLLALLAVAEMVLGPTLEALRAVSVVSDATTATALFLLARRFGDSRIGVFAAVLYPVLSLIAIGYDAYCPLAALTTLAFLAALSPLSLILRAALAGLAIGAAGTVKQTAGFEAVALLAILVSAPDGVRRRGWAALSYGLGVGVAPLGFLLYFAWHGAAAALFADTVVTALQRPASASEGISFAGGFVHLLPLQQGLLPLTGLSLLAALRRRALKDAAPELPWGALLAWLAAAAVAVLAQRSLFAPYLAPMLAPALLLAGFFMAKALPELARIPASARLALLALLSIAAALTAPSVDFVKRQDLPALTAAAEAIRASAPSPGDKLYVVNRSVWLNSMVDLAPPTKYLFPFQTLCAFPGVGGGAVAEILAARPRYVAIADRSMKYYCERPESWRLIDAALVASYRRLAHAEGAFDSYDVYEAVAESH